MTSVTRPIYSSDASVFLINAPDKKAALTEAINSSRFLRSVEAARVELGKPLAAFTIAIKLDLPTSGAGTDLELAEELVSTLNGAGFRKISLVESFRTVAQCSRSIGERELLDLSTDTAEFDFGEELGVCPVGRAWIEADYRVSFAKNKTHPSFFHAASLKNILGCMPGWDMLGGRVSVPRAAVLSAERLPVHFGFLDAWASSDGFDGALHQKASVDTRMVLASQNIVALDWVAAEKMNIDPSLNDITREAVLRFGSLHIQRRGDMTPWREWRNIRMVAAVLFRGIPETSGVLTLCSRGLQGALCRFLLSKSNEALP